MTRLFSSRRPEQCVTAGNDLRNPSDQMYTYDHKTSRKSTSKWSSFKRALSANQSKYDTRSPTSESLSATTLAPSPPPTLEYSVRYYAGDGHLAASIISPSDSISVVRDSKTLSTSPPKPSVSGWDMFVNLAPKGLSKQKLLEIWQLANRVQHHSINENPSVSQWLQDTPPDATYSGPMIAIPTSKGLRVELGDSWHRPELAGLSIPIKHYPVHELDSLTSSPTSTQLSSPIEPSELDGSTIVSAEIAWDLRNTDISTLEGLACPSTSTTGVTPILLRMTDEPGPADASQDIVTPSATIAKVHPCSELEGVSSDDLSEPLRSHDPDYRSDCPTGSDLEGTTKPQASQSLVCPVCQDTNDTLPDTANNTTPDATSSIASGPASMKQSQFDHASLTIITTSSPTSSICSEPSSTFSSPTVFSPASSQVSSAPTSCPPSPDSNPTSPVTCFSAVMHQDEIQKVLSEVDGGLLPQTLRLFSEISAASHQARILDFLCAGNQAVRSHAAGGSSTGSGYFSGTTSTNNQAGATSGGTDRSVLGKRARDDDDDGSGEGGNEGRNPGETAMLPRERHKKKLACPFNKFDPITFQLREDSKTFRTCARGFANPKDLQDHLKTVHSGPKFYCDRCCERFKTDSAKQRHAKQVPACEPRDDPEFMQAYVTNPDKRKKAFKKKLAKHTVEQHWFGIWDELFPEAERPSSVYHDFAELKAIFDQAVDEVISNFVPGRAAEVLGPDADPDNIQRLMRELSSAIRTHIFDQLENGNNAWSTLVLPPRASDGSPPQEYGSSSQASTTETVEHAQNITSHQQHNAAEDWIYSSIQQSVQEPESEFLSPHEPFLDPPYLPYLNLAPEGPFIDEHLFQ